MFCTSCGTQVPENSGGICPNCGKAIEREVNSSAAPDYTRQRLQQGPAGAMGGGQGMWQGGEDMRNNRVVRDFSEMFVSGDEQAKGVIGGGYLDNWIQMGGLSKGFGVATNRRLYYKGKCFHKLGGNYVKTNEEWIVDLQDITSSGFTYTKHLWMLLTAIAAILIGISVAVQGKSFGPFVPFLLIFALMLAGYFFFRITMYTVTFAGGSLSIKASSFGMKELKAFDKTLRQAKDDHLRSLR